MVVTGGAIVARSDNPQQGRRHRPLRDNSAGLAGCSLRALPRREGGLSAESAIGEQISMERYIDGQEVPLHLQLYSL